MLEKTPAIKIPMINNMIEALVNENVLLNLCLTKLIFCRIFGIGIEFFYRPN